MNRVVLAVVSAILAAVPASLAHAQSGGGEVGPPVVIAPPASFFVPAPGADDLEATMETWLSDLGLWSQGRIQAAQDRSQRLVDITMGINALWDQVEAGAEIAKTRAWAEPWAARMRAGLDAEDRALARADKPAPTFPRGPAISNAELREIDLMVKRIDDMRPLYQDFFAETRAVALRAIDAVEAAAAGDDDALVGLGLIQSDLTIETIKSESILVRASIVRPGSPAAALSDAVLANNDGYLAWAFHQRNILSGEPLDTPTVAATMRRSGELQKAAADRLRLGADISVAFPSIASARGTDLHARMEAAVQTYAESADVEAELAELMLELADALEADDAEWQDMVLILSDELIVERIEIDNRRRATIAGLSVPK